jgi:2-dehydro-3-deoxyphosphooctonate aldolase (KDO 8-P synthase)
MVRSFVIGPQAGVPVPVGGAAPLVVIAGPCVIEGADQALQTAQRLAEICQRLELGFVFKSSYLKDNRTSVESFVGPGLDEGLRILERVRREVGVPVLSDVHERAEIPAAAEVLDVLQIPAFLCRQTRLLTEAAATGRCVNVKKGQFLAPTEVRHLVARYESGVGAARHSDGAGGLLLTERGASFGYGNLVVDMRGLEIMRATGYPVVFDVTHSLQMPGTGGAETGGERRFAPLMARAASAAGVDALFLESHPEPAAARSDRHTQVPLREVGALLETAREFHALERRLLRPAPLPDRTPVEESAHEP